MLRDHAGLVDQTAAGCPDNVCVRISLTSRRQRDLAAFEQAVVEVPEVMECCLMSGEADYLPRVVGTDARDYERIHNAHLTQLPGVAPVHSSFPLRSVVKRTELLIRRQAAGDGGA